MGTIATAKSVSGPDGIGRVVAEQLGNGEWAAAIESVDYR